MSGSGASTDHAKLRHSYIHAAILFADLENSVMLSATLPPLDYNQLLNDTQAAMQALVDDLRQRGFPVAEASIAGDQLVIFFYDPTEVQRNAALDTHDHLTEVERAELIKSCRVSNDMVLYSAFLSAIQLKNLWLLQEFNMSRVLAQREPLGLGIGLHFGQVYLGDRPDGRCRIEGFAINLGKRIEGYARQGRYSHIMLSQPAHDKLRGMVRKHTQLRQRIYFHQHEVALELLKGVTEAQAVFELKFLSLIGDPITAAMVKQHEAIFYLNPRNIWSYYQLFEYYAYETQEWDKVLAAVKHAMLAHPHDEKLLLDLARYYFVQGDAPLARQLAQQALAMNPDLDLAYELLAKVANQEDELDNKLQYWREAVGLAPGSPLNHLNLGLALCEAGILQTAEHHLVEAIDGYPDYVRNADTIRLVTDFHRRGRLPEVVAAKFGLKTVPTSR